MLILFSIDGLRPDAIAAANTPAIDRLIADGASTMAARTVMPCCTLPCHTTMFRGVDVGRHGINTNTFHPLVRPVPSIIDWAASQGLKTGMFLNWAQLRDLCEPDSAHVLFALRDAHHPEDDNRVADAAIDSARHGAPDVMFVYFGHVDEVGHVHGWMSDPYLRAVENADRCVGQVLDAFPERSVLLLSDHGGHDRTHGTECAEDMTIPFVLRGGAIKPGFAITEPVVITQTAPTAAKLLGLQPPREWDAAPVESAFA